MKTRDVVIGGGEAWEVTKIREGGSVLVRLVAGAGVSARTSEIPSSLLQGRSIYRRISVVEDVDVALAGAEVARHVEEDKLQWYPRLWVEEFLRRYPSGSSVPDATVLLGWFDRLIHSGAARVKAEASDRRRERKESEPANVRARGGVTIKTKKVRVTKPRSSK